MPGGGVVRVARDRVRILGADPVIQVVYRSVAPHACCRRCRRCRRRRRRVAGRRRRRCRVTRDHGRLRLRRSRRRDRLGHLAGEVLRPLVHQIDSEDVRASPSLRGEGEGEERLALLLVRVGLLVDARQRVCDEGTQWPVDVRRCRLGALVVQYVQHGVGELCVVLELAGVGARDVDALGVAGLVGQPDLEAILATRLVEELLHPGVVGADREVPDLGVVERLDVGVQERRIDADLGGELLELRILVSGLERRRDAVGPETTWGSGHRVLVELVTLGALGCVRQQFAGLDGQIGRVAGIADIRDAGGVTGSTGQTDGGRRDEQGRRSGYCRHNGSPLGGQVGDSREGERHADKAEQKHPEGCSESQPQHDAGGQDDASTCHSLAVLVSMEGSGRQDHAQDQGDTREDRKDTHWTVPFSVLRLNAGGWKGC